MKAYIDSYSKRISVKEREAFLTDVMEDLQQMDQSRIVGLGITAMELDDWIKKSHSQFETT